MGRGEVGVEWMAVVVVVLLLLLRLRLRLLLLQLLLVIPLREQLVIDPTTLAAAPSGSAPSLLRRRGANLAAYGACRTWYYAYYAAHGIDDTQHS